MSWPNASASPARARATRSVVTTPPSHHLFLRFLPMRSPVLTPPGQRTGRPAAAQSVGRPGSAPSTAPMAVPRTSWPAVAPLGAGRTGGSDRCLGSCSPPAPQRIPPGALPTPWPPGPLPGGADMAAIEPIPTRQPPAGSGRPAGPRWGVVLASVGFFMVALDALVVITALPAIGRDLGGGMATLEWTVNAYTLTFAGGIITAAALGDRLGRRRVYAGGLVLFTAASAACALAPSAGLLVAARAVQGLGAAAVMPLSLTILTAAFPAQRRGAIVGIWGGIAGIAVASGPLVGGAVTQGLDWHWIFWVNGAIGLAAALLSVVFVAESHGPATRLDLPAVGLVSGGVTGIIWALVRANEVGWTSPEILTTLTLGAGLLAGFVAWERRAPEPTLPRR